MPAPATRDPSGRGEPARREALLEVALRRLEALAPLDPGAQLDAALALLRAAGDERQPRADALDGRLLEAICQRALGGARGAVFTPAPEASILAAFGLAHAAAARDPRVDPAHAVAALLGAAGTTAGPATTTGPAAMGAGVGRTTVAATAPGVSAAEDAVRDLSRALDGLRVLDFACGGGALLAAAEILAQRVGARLTLLGCDVSPLAARATQGRLALLGASASIRVADAVAEPWPAAELVLANPPFLRHEALAADTKAAAARASGLSRQADLSAHLAALAIRAAPVAALVLPRALDTSRSAAPFRGDARARGGFVLRLRSACAGSFAASVDTWLSVWVEGGRERSAVEAAVPLDALGSAQLAALARGIAVGPLRQVRGEVAALAGVGRSPRSANAVAQAPAETVSAARSGGAPSRRGCVRLGDVAEVRFGMKSGANAFFHLEPLGDGRYRSALAGVVALAEADVAPLLASLKEVRAPKLAEPTRVLFRPTADSATARAYVRLGERLGVARRPTCAGRSPWWRIAPGRRAAPVLYPAKIGARAFAFLNTDGLCEDKKWHALFPRGDEPIEPWLLAAVLGATPVRLAIDVAARQLTGAQAIADVDCGVLAAAPFPAPAALPRLRSHLERCWLALARDPVTTDLEAALGRAAQRELDGIVGSVLGMSAAAVERCRRELLARVAGRLEHAAHVRDALLRTGAPAGRNTRAGRGVRQRGVLADHPGRQLPPLASKEPFTP